MLEMAETHYTYPFPKRQNKLREKNTTYLQLSPAVHLCIPLFFLLHKQNEEYPDSLHASEQNHPSLSGASGFPRHSPCGTSVHQGTPGFHILPCSFQLVGIPRKVYK